MKLEEKIEFVITTLEDCLKIKQEMIEHYNYNATILKIVSISSFIADALKKGHKIIVFGNGGSASDSQHFTAELVGKFMKNRKPLPAISLTTNTSILTAIANDYSFEDIFSRQIEALANKGDVVIAISTSGLSENVLKAVETAKKMKIATIGLTGANGGKLSLLADLCIKVPTVITPRIQEEHITVLHILCDLIEREMFDE